MEGVWATSPDLLVHIFSFLNLKSLACCSLTNRSWHTLVDGERELWRRLFLTEVEVNWDRSPSDSLLNWEAMLKDYLEAKKQERRPGSEPIKWGFGVIAGSASAALSWVTSATSPFLNATVKEQLIRFILRFPSAVFYKATAEFLDVIEKSIQDNFKAETADPGWKRPATRLDLPLWYKELSQVLLLLNPFESLTLTLRAPEGDDSHIHMSGANYVFEYLPHLPPCHANNARLFINLSGVGETSTGRYCGGRDHAWGIAVDEDAESADNRCGPLYEWCFEGGYANRWVALKEYPMLFSLMASYKTKDQIVEASSVLYYDLSLDLSFSISLGEANERISRNLTTRLALDIDTLSFSGSLNVELLHSGLTKPVVTELTLEGSLKEGTEVALVGKIGGRPVCSFTGQVEYTVRGHNAIAGTIVAHVSKIEERPVWDTNECRVQVLEGQLVAYSIPPPPPSVDSKVINIAKQKVNLLLGATDPYHVLQTYGKKLPEDDKLWPIVEALQKSHGKCWKEYTDLGPVLLLIAWLRLRSYFLHVYTKEDKDALRNRRKPTRKERKRWAKEGTPPESKFLRSLEEKNRQIIDEELPSWYELVEFVRALEIQNKKNEKEKEPKEGEGPQPQPAVIPKWMEWRYWGWPSDARWPRELVPDIAFPLSMLLFSADAEESREGYHYDQRSSFGKDNTRKYIEEIETIFNKHPDPTDTVFPYDVSCEFTRQLIIPYGCLSYRMNNFAYVCCMSIIRTQGHYRKGIFRFIVDKLMDSLSGEAEKRQPDLLPALIDSILLDLAGMKGLKKTCLSLLVKRGRRVLEQMHTYLVTDTHYLNKEALHVINAFADPSSIPVLNHCLLYVNYENAKIREALAACQANAIEPEGAAFTDEAEFDRFLAQQYHTLVESCVVNPVIDRTKKPVTPPKPLPELWEGLPPLLWNISKQPLSTDATKWLYAVAHIFFGIYCSITMEAYTVVVKFRDMIDKESGHTFVEALLRHDGGAEEYGGGLPEPVLALVALLGTERVLEKIQTPRDRYSNLNVPHHYKLHGSRIAFYWVLMHSKELALQSEKSSQTNTWLMHYATEAEMDWDQYVDHLIAYHHQFTEKPELKEKDRKLLQKRLAGYMREQRRIPVSLFGNHFAATLVGEALQPILLGYHSSSEAQQQLCTAEWEDGVLALYDIHRQPIERFSSSVDKKKFDEEAWVLIVHPIDLSETEQLIWTKYFEGNNIPLAWPDFSNAKDTLGQTFKQLWVPLVIPGNHLDRLTDPHSRLAYLLDTINELLVTVTSAGVFSRALGSAKYQEGNRDYDKPFTIHIGPNLELVLVPEQEVSVFSLDQTTQLRFKKISISWGCGIASPEGKEKEKEKEKEDEGQGISLAVLNEALVVLNSVKEQLAKKEKEDGGRM